MNSVRAWVISVVVGMVVGFAGPVRAAETFKVDATHSSVVFRVKHMGVSYTYGRFNDVAGAFSIDEGHPAESGFDITVKSASIDTESDSRDNHLRSPDFFNVKQFPEITFKSKSVKKSGEIYKVTGDLTLLGVTKSITIDVEHIGTAEHPRSGNAISGVETVFTIKRSDYGMTYGLGGVGDEVKLMVSLEGGAG